MKKNLWQWGKYLLVLLLVNFPLLSHATLPPLIPRTLLFGNPEKAMARIAPNGQWYAYLAPSEKGVINVWIQDLAGSKPAVMVTNDQHRGIRQYNWTKDSKYILYLQDTNGDENWHVHLVTLQNKQQRDLTPFPKVRAANLILSTKYPQQLLVGLNKRDPKIFDMYRVDLQTGKMALDTLNPGDVIQWGVDPNFQILAAIASNNKDGSTTLRVRHDVKSSWRTLITWPFGESGDIIDYAADSKSLYISNTLNSDTEQLQEINPENGKIIKTLAHDTKSDIDDIFYNEISHQIQAISFNYLKPRWKILDPTVKVDFARIKKWAGEHFIIVNRDTADKMWLIAVFQDNATPSYYAYHRPSGTKQLLFVSQPALSKYKLSSMKPIIIKARDGLPLVSYLSLPVGIAAKNLPLVINVHGGPWARDDWGYDPEAQWLTNRGYAVLQVNFRGSTDFGKRFLNAGNEQWGVGSMQHDLTDAVNWAIHQGIADPKKICIYGGSYGGYATVAGLAFTPKLYACGIDLVGPVNLKTLLASIPPYWLTTKKEMLLRIGDVEKDDKFNQKYRHCFTLTIFVYRYLSRKVKMIRE